MNALPLFSGCGEELFTCLDHCAQCTPPHARHVRED